MEITKNDWNLIELPNLIDISPYIQNVPSERGVIKYQESGEIIKENEDTQVSGSLARYNYPLYKPLFYEIKKLVENIIKEKLYPTYYYDRFYFSGQELKKHVDRDSCEISVSLNISQHINYDWPIFFEKNNQTAQIICNPGDGVLYKGRELVHWRPKLKGNQYNYYHQLFLHYVRADGHFLQHAYDRI
jgi:hypothetical protein